MTPASPVHFRIPPRLNLLIARGRRAAALKLLDKIIGSDYGLFRADAEILQDRQAALHFKIDLLLEWDRYSEALAWLCLETEINPDNVLAQAMKQRLKRQLHIDDLDRGRQQASRLQEAPAFSNPIRWDDVAGMRELKLTLENDIIMPFLEPEIYKRYRVPLPNGILFYGPPGCGKTFIARKLASMMHFNFIELKPSDLASIYVHGTQGKIGETFRQAADEGPTLLFFDEIDAFIPSRGQGLDQHYSAEVNEFLSQMNECADRQILVIGATNYLSRVDVAVRRPGRFDKKIYVGPPDLEARIEAVKLYMKGRPQEEIDFFRLLADKERYSFADLELVVNESARDALQTRQPIASQHIEEVFARLPPSITIEVIEDMSRE
jgi:transitional endoplasmic reticulum ATPase